MIVLCQRDKYIALVDSGFVKDVATIIIVRHALCVVIKGLFDKCKVLCARMLLYDILFL